MKKQNERAKKQEILKELNFIESIELKISKVLPSSKEFETKRLAYATKNKGKKIGVFFTFYAMFIIHNMNSFAILLGMTLKLFINSTVLCSGIFLYSMVIIFYWVCNQIIFWFDDKNSIHDELWKFSKMLSRFLIFSYACAYLVSVLLYFFKIDDWIFVLVSFLFMYFAEVLNIIFSLLIEQRKKRIIKNK